MPVLARRTLLPHPHADVWDWHLRSGAFERLSPPFAPAEVVRWEPVALGARQSLVIHKGRAWSWEARITELEEGVGFTDVQERGPFARWEHRHRFLPDPSGGCVLSDEVTWEPPLGALGRLVAGATIAKDLERTFAFRHQRTADDLARHRRFASQGPKRIAVSGASGLIGRALVAFLESGGHEVKRMVRRPVHGPHEVLWRPEAEVIDLDALRGIDAVVHLAGEPIAQRWTAEARKRIERSRVHGTRMLSEALARLDKPPEVLISASAVGFYGDGGDRVLEEDAPPGEGFLAGVCKRWEEAAAPAVRAGIRVVHPRTGLVLDPRGGALGAMRHAYALGLGGRIGSGTQYMPWVSLDDAIGMIHHALFTPSLVGPMNVTAPEPATQIAFAHALGRVLGRPTLTRLPAAELRFVLGDLADEMLLYGQRAVPSRAVATGFTPLHPHLEDALRAVLGRT